MKNRVRFHLGEGPHKGHWQVRRGSEVEYHDPAAVSLTLRGCRLVNRRATASRIYCWANKTPCAWVECEAVEPRPAKKLRGRVVRYNPREAPHWIVDGQDADGTAFAVLATTGRNVVAL